MSPGELDAGEGQASTPKTPDSDGASSNDAVPDTEPSVGMATDAVSTS